MTTPRLPVLKTAPVPKWRGSSVKVEISGMVLGEEVDGIVTVFDPDTGLAYRVGVEALWPIDRQRP